MDDETKKLILETLGLFFAFCIMMLIVGILAGCTSKLEAETKTGTPLGHDRFYVIEGEKGETYNTETIYVDTETGVQYLWVRSGYAGGLTVLLDHDGKPLIAEGYRDY